MQRYGITCISDYAQANMAQTFAHAAWNVMSKILDPVPFQKISTDPIEITEPANPHWQVSKESIAQ